MCDGTGLGSCERLRARGGISLCAGMYRATSYVADRAAFVVAIQLLMLYPNLPRPQDLDLRYCRLTSATEEATGLAALIRYRTTREMLQNSLIMAHTVWYWY